VLPIDSKSCEASLAKYAGKVKHMAKVTLSFLMQFNKKISIDQLAKLLHSEYILLCNIIIVLYNTIS